MKMLTPKFPLGQVVATPGAIEAMEEAGQNPAFFLDLHVSGNWGIVSEEDGALNDQALMHLVVRLMAAVYARKALPEGITTPEEAESWACEFAREHRWRVCLVVSRRISLWIDSFGLVEARTEATPGVPDMPVGGLRFLLE